MTTGEPAGGDGPVAADAPRVILVETSDALPGLLPFQAWDALATASAVFVRDPDAHPSAQHLYFAGLDLERLEPTPLAREDLDLTKPGAPDDRRLAKALLERAAREGVVVYLLGPGDEGFGPVLGGASTAYDAEIEFVFLAQQPAGAEFIRLVEVLQRLRDPDDGCPWDLEQDHRSLAPYLVEETYEVVDAIDRAHDVDLREELGDVLLQVVFHAQVARDRGSFGIDDVTRGIVDKLIRRHPHVFADTEAATAEDVQRNWDRLKAEEKPRRVSPFEGVPAAQPGLLLLETLQRKAGKAGVDPAVLGEPFARARASLEALRTAADADGREAAFGDLLDAVVAAARALEVDPEAAARASGRRFRARVEAVVRVARERELDLGSADAAELRSLWEATADVAG